MTILSVSDASRMAGVAQHTLKGQIDNGELMLTADGVELCELIRVYPKLKPLANIKLRQVKQGVKRTTKNSSVTALAVVDVSLDATPSRTGAATKKSNTGQTTIAGDSSNVPRQASAMNQTGSADRETNTGEADTFQLLVRELEWNKELLEQTNRQMAKQLAEQQAMIADQARRLDEKDRFWARQVEIAQSLLPAPAPKQRKKLFGIF